VATCTTNGPEVYSMEWLAPCAIFCELDCYQGGHFGVGYSHSWRYQHQCF
jgi:hypothetical protein